MTREAERGDAVCWICGQAGHHTYRYCSEKKAFVCLHCELYRCPNYSAATLPNGTHCRVSYARESEKDRRINRVFIAPIERVNAARERYKGFTAERLYEEYCVLLEKYDKSSDNLHRAALRIELAAMQAEMKGGTASRSENRKDIK